MSSMFGPLYQGPQSQVSQHQQTPQTSSILLTIQELDVLRNNIISNLSIITLNKNKIRPDDYNGLNNYLRYSLNILDNMKTVKTMEDKNPHKQFKLLHHNDNPYYNDVKDVYKAPKISNNLWEQQFDLKVINPTQGTLPPSNVWQLERQQKDPNFL